MPRRLVLCVLCGLWAAAAAHAQDPAQPTQPPVAAGAAAAADSTAAAFADSTAAALADSVAAPDPYAAYADSLEALGYKPAMVQNLVRHKREQDARAAADAAAADTMLFSNCTNVPEATVQANVTKVSFAGSLANTVKVKDGGSIADTYRWAYDTYRRQDKTVETRSANATYTSGELLPVTLKLLASVDWSDDLTTNTGGSTNQNKRQTRRAGVSASKSRVQTGDVQHTLNAGWYYNDFESINQQERNDNAENEVNASLRSKVDLAAGLALAGRLYGIKRDGDSQLAGFESPSSTTGDTLGADAYYQRRVATGQVTLSQSSFDKRYLDYRRNSNGLIDTLNLPEGASKVVRELEEQDAWDLRWDNTLKAGRIKFTSALQHTFDKQQYAESGVGRKDRNADQMKLGLMFPAGRDSFALTYEFKWTWDDQQFAGAESSRGRQYQKTRDFALDWIHDLFANTVLSGRYSANLVQDIAEDRFNENDRDRLTQTARLKLESAWSGAFTTTLLGEYNAVDDIAIRTTRSANNNTKRTYEVAPGYRLVLSPRVEFAQVFRMYIQYQDYDFAYIGELNKNDTFNKRGNLASTLTLHPSERVDLVVKHDYNQKFNGTRTNRDASGEAFYRRDQDQVINRVELGLTWTVVQWSQTEVFKLQTATYRTKDTVTRFGTTETETTNYSGELWIGAVLGRDWGPDDRPLHMDARIKRYLAYGPNVTDTSDDYWEADVLLRWTF